MDKEDWESTWALTTCNLGKLPKTLLDQGRIGRLESNPLICDPTELYFMVGENGLVSQLETTPFWVSLQRDVNSMSHSLTLHKKNWDQ